MIFSKYKHALHARRIKDATLFCKDYGPVIAFYLIAACSLNANDPELAVMGKIGLATVASMGYMLVRLNQLTAEAINSVQDRRP